MTRPLLVAAALALFAVGSTTAATAQTSEIRACYAPASATHPGMLYLASSSPTGRCADDLSISWNAQGPAGPAGAQGESGPQGPPGALPAATVSRLAAKIRRASALEKKLAKAKPGSKAERAALLALARLQRESTAELLNALSP